MVRSSRFACASLPSRSFLLAALGVAAWFCPATSAASAAELRIVLPLRRTAYQTNERIDLAVVRQSPEALAAGELALAARHEDGGELRFVFAVGPAAAVGGVARRTEHLHLDGRLLRPGRYALEAACDGATAAAAIEVYGHVRRTSYRLINWGRAKGAQQLVEGDEGLGFNLFYGHYAHDEEANFIRAGMDFMSCCTMSGGHQMDLRAECDWSDPYVVRGGTRRAVQRAMADRARGNVPGVHFYDEPGLTWAKDPVTGQMTPHAVPAQHRAYRSAFGHDPISHRDVDPANPDHVARWRHWALWKLGFIDAAWKDADFGVRWVRPDYLSVTQSQYGFPALADGYYFNVARSLPVTSGHGGYDDYGQGYFNPAWTLEMARARDFSKPCWYLPTWYGNTPADRFRLEQYLCFMTNIQGMITPPDIDPFDPSKSPAAEGVVEANRLMARLGTIFTAMPVTRPPVALLYSISNHIHVQTRDRTKNYSHDNPHGRRLPLAYLAGKLLQQQFMAVVEEDVLDGTLAANHRAIVLVSIEYLPAEVIAALEQFAAGGGLVLATSDCAVKIAGAVDLGVVPDLPEADIANRLHAEGKHQEAAPYETVGKLYEGAMPLARAIQARLDRAGIAPIFVSSEPAIAATRQADGDVEYLFAVNAAYDAAAGGRNAIRAAETTLELPDDGRPVYDAVRGGRVEELKPGDGRLAGRFRFGPGQMRVLARTSRPIGGVEIFPPVTRCEPAGAGEPLRLELGALVVDDQRRPLGGAIPLQLVVVDPLGARRYDLYRATSGGVLRVTLPLAANDPPGRWRVTVCELLDGRSATAEFDFAPPGALGAAAGASRRAVMLGNEADNVFRFFRVHHDVTIVRGEAPYHAAAAQRIADVLRPWGIRARTVAAAEVNRPRPLSEEEAATWVGLEFGRAKPGADNSVAKAGFDLPGPAILLGTPEDNPLIAFLKKESFLPYVPDGATFPGPGRGLIAWQRDALAAAHESIALIAYDAAGMDEAVGTLYEAAAGIEPLTPLEPPRACRSAPVVRVEKTAALKPLWRHVLPDRAIAMKPTDAGTMRVLAWDGSLVELDAAGKIVSSREVPWSDQRAVAESLRAATDPAAMEQAAKTAPAGRIVKFAAARGDLLAVGYWGGALELRRADGSLAGAERLPQDLAAMAWLGETLWVALSDGQIVSLDGRP